MVEGRGLARLLELRVYSRVDLAVKVVLLAVGLVAIGGLTADSGDPRVAAYGLPVLVLAGWLALRRTVRRARLSRALFPEAWRRLLRERVAFYAGLDEAGRRRFEDDVRFVVAEHVFEGSRGVEVTDALKVLVAAAAAMMLHGRPEWELPRGHTILLYPDHFDADFEIGSGGRLLGQAQGQGPIIFSVPSLLRGFANPGDADNVALHELAHLLDFEQARADGVPRMLNPAAVVPWLRLVEREIERVRTGESPLREYAATSNAELFAFSVEHFFERPRELREGSPELYRALAELFNQDLAESGTGTVAGR